MYLAKSDQARQRFRVKRPCFEDQMTENPTIRCWARRFAPQPERRVGIMKMKRMIPFLNVFLLLVVSGCSAGETPQKQAPVEAVVVVLGNEPLDDNTPTVDMVARVRKAVAFQKEHLNTVLLFTGGPTAGTTTEARMMADLAVAQGASTNSIFLEEKARSTQENARLTARMIRDIAPRRVLIVSKEDHLDWAMPIFRKVDAFTIAEPLPCQVSRTDSIAQMEEYLKKHENARVRERLQQLKNGVKGTD